MDLDWVWNAARSNWQDELLLLARLGFASMFLASAYDKFRGDPEEIGMIRRLHLPAPASLEALTGVCEVVGAGMILLGIGARLGAVALLSFVALTTIAFLRYWSAKAPPPVRHGLRNLFYANWATAGGLLYLAVAGPGRLALMPGAW